MTYVRWSEFRLGHPSVPGRTVRETKLCEDTCPSKAGQGPAARVHVVRSGETLSEIAFQYGTSVEALAQVNRIENLSLIYVGQKLVIP
jgi:LysM repeat protein